MDIAVFVVIILCLLVLAVLLSLIWVIGMLMDRLFRLLGVKLNRKSRAVGWQVLGCLAVGVLLIVKWYTIVAYLAMGVAFYLIFGGEASKERQERKAT